MHDNEFSQEFEEYIPNQNGGLKGAQVWDVDVLDFNDFFIMKSI